MLQAAIQERQSKASSYKIREPQEIEPEYIPWTGENSETAIEVLFLLVYNSVFQVHLCGLKQICTRGMMLTHEFSHFFL